jgi:hypothetical protein
MSTSLKLLGSAAVVLVSVLVLVAVRDRTVEVPDGVVLVLALAMLTRTALRSASDTAGRRYPRE